MAVTTLLFLLLTLPFPALSRRHHHHSPVTATLDVSAALAATSAVVSGQPAAATQQSLHEYRHGHRHQGLGFSLHPRHMVAGAAAHKSYSDLTQSRLRRDAARVEALTARLRLAVAGVGRSDLVPLETTELTMEAAAAMEGPVVSGTKQGSGEYFSRVGIGSPAKELYMVLDTGSDVTWVQCQPCADCYQQADPIYDPATSSSFAPVPCESTQCHALDVSACRNSSCLYQVSYGDGSFTVGDFATETVSFGSGENSVPGVAFGCGHDNEGLFVGAAGLLGLGRGTLSFPSQIPASSFSYCLVDRDSASSSTLEFGRNGSSDGDLSVATAAAGTVTAPLLRNRKLDTFYYVGLTGLSVGGRPLSIPESTFAMDDAGNGGVIVDSGTAVTRLHPDAYAALRDAFKSGTTGLPAAGSVALFDTCYDLSSRTTVEVPTVALRFPEARELRLPAKNYLIPVDGQGTFCLAFAPTSSAASLSIIGNVQQQGTRVSFDLENDRVGFSPSKC